MAIISSQAMNELTHKPLSNALSLSFFLFLEVLPIAQLFDVSTSTVSNWLTSEIVSSDTFQIPPNCSELEFDEMQNFISSRRTSTELAKQFLVQPVESLSGLSVIVMLIPPTDQTPGQTLE